MASKKTIWDIFLNVGGKEDGSATKAFNNVKRQIKDVQNATKQLGKSFKDFAGSAAKLAAGATAAFTAVTAGVLKGVDDVAMRGDTIAKFSREVGIGAEAYQELSYAMRQCGLEQSDFDAALKKYNLTVSQAAAGNEAAAKQLRAVGLEGAKMAQFSPEENIRMLSDYFKDLPSDMARTQAAVQLFGKAAGPKMLLAMKDGSEGLQLLRDEARRTGMIIEQEMLDQAEQYSSAKQKMKDTFEGVKTQFFLGSIEAITEAFGDISDETQGLLPKVRELGDRFGQWLKDMVTKIPEIITKAKEFAATVRENVDRIVEMAGGWENVSKIMAGLVVAPTAIKGLGVVLNLAKLAKAAFGIIPGILGAIGKAGGFGFGAISTAALPVIGIIAGIAAIAYVVIKNWDEFKAKGLEAFEKIKTAMKPVVDAIKTFIKAITDFWEKHGETVIGVLETIGDFIKNVIMLAIDVVVAIITNGVNIVMGIIQTLGAVFSLVFDTIKTIVQVFIALFKGDFSGAAEIIKGFISRLGEHFSAIFDGIKSVISGLVQFWSDIFSGIFDFIFNFLGDLGERWGEVFIKAQEIVSNVIDVVKSTIQGFFNKVKSIISGIPGIFTTAFNAVKDAVTGAINFIMGPINAVKDALGGIIGGIKNAVTGTKDLTDNIPDAALEHATGGIFKKPHLGWVGEAGGEGVIPYTRPEGLGLWAEVGKLGGYFKQLGKTGIPGTQGEPGIPGIPGKPFEMPALAGAAGGARGGDTISMGAPQINITINGNPDEQAMNRIKGAGRQAAQDISAAFEEMMAHKRRVSFS